MDTNISLLYVKSLIPESELDTIADALRQHEIEFHRQPDTGEPKASLYELVAPVMLFFSTELAQAYLVGMAASATYDLIKVSTLTLVRQISGKTLSLLHAGGKESKIPVSMDLFISLNDRVNLRLKFTSTLPSELQETCVNKAFQLVRQRDLLISKTEQVAVFNEATQEWAVCSDAEFIEKMFMKDSANKPSHHTT